MMMKKTARKYTPGEAYTVTYEMLRTIRPFLRAKKKNLLGSAFIERLMLAVTQVNGCAICSYMHTAEALKAGLSEKEIQEILSGSIENIPREECIAVFFAQHYGEKKALAILAVVRTIMFGNVFGIPLGSLLNRIRGLKGQGFSLMYELAMMMLAIPFFAVGSLHVLCGLFIRSDVIRFAP